ncbi:MAG: putative RNA methyltransferase [Clostridia bacterium]|jgi:23S rRNA (guanine745-N1)-methyltransferase|nr:methyltransferase domain-containing protein [Clostridiales bacterium]
MKTMQVKENLNLFRCPFCGGKMRMVGEKSIVCAKNHCFDLAKRGYVNLLTSPAKTDYDKEMLKSRSIIIRNGLFEPLTGKLAGLILDHAGGPHTNVTRILDAGCGEGSHLARVIQSMKGRNDRRVTGVGIDISKEGIQIASREYPSIAWCVADLAKVPFKDGSFDAILNILSPANYAEFKRLLTGDGILIKVVPGSKYLLELRELFYRSTGKEKYSNERIVAHFEENFNTAGTWDILYSIPVDKHNLEHLIRMTPLSWGAADERIKEVLRIGIPHITIDLAVILGINKSM